MSCALSLSLRAFLISSTSPTAPSNVCELMADYHVSHLRLVLCGGCVQGDPLCVVLVSVLPAWVPLVHDHSYPLHDEGRHLLKVNLVLLCGIVQLYQHY